VISEELKRRKVEKGGLKGKIGEGVEQIVHM